jgi:hypothetical protein
MANRFWSRKWGEFPRLEYSAWRSMVARCCDKRNPSYPRYGGRGIRVCERWRRDFMSFLSDMGPRPSPVHSIDRLDNDGDYALENCRWATPWQQAHNIGRMRNAMGVEPNRRSWRACMRIGGHRTTLGSFDTFEEARRAYRQAALRNRIIAELSAAWARDSVDREHDPADDDSLDNRLLNLLLEASRAPRASAQRKPAAHRVKDQRNRAKSPPAPRSQSARSIVAGRKPMMKRS